MIFDTHTHYDDHAFDADRESLIAGLREAGVAGICNIGSTFEGALDSAALAAAYDNVYAAVGIHPDEVYDFYPEIAGRPFDATGTARIEEAFGSGYAESENKVFDKIKELAGQEKVRAIGEIGLDYHGFDRYEIKPGKEIQKYWFRRQLLLATELGLPVVIHSRNASADTLDMMREAHANGLKCAVIHCYSYSAEVAAEYVKLGFYLGFGGAITYEGQKKITKALKETPIGRVLLETDCPYLAPVPVRTPGKTPRNESGYLPYVVQRIAQIKGMSPEDVERVTYENAERFYGIR